MLASAELAEDIEAAKRAGYAVRKNINGHSFGTVTATGLQCDYYGVQDGVGAQNTVNPILFERPNPGGTCLAYPSSGNVLYGCGSQSIPCPHSIPADSVEDPAWSLNHLMTATVLPQGVNPAPAHYTAATLQCEGQASAALTDVAKLRAWGRQWATATRTFGNLRNCQAINNQNVFLATFTCMVAASP